LNIPDERTYEIDKCIELIWVLVKLRNCIKKSRNKSHDPVVKFEVSFSVAVPASASPDFKSTSTYAASGSSGSRPAYTILVRPTNGFIARGIHLAAL
jgi:hypothetical protein